MIGPGWAEAIIVVFVLALVLAARCLPEILKRLGIN
jgi:Sec-independent protein translocase protein TatA